MNLYEKIYDELGGRSKTSPRMKTFTTNGGTSVSPRVANRPRVVRRFAKGTPIREIFFAYIEKASTGYKSECWLWTGTLDPDGYGKFSQGYSSTRGRSLFAHRWAYAEWVRMPTSEESIDHLCKVRRCVRPTHLEAVSHGENVRRGSAGKWRRARSRLEYGHAPMTYYQRRELLCSEQGLTDIMCVNGHPVTEHWDRCRQCHRERERGRRSRRQE